MKQNIMNIWEFLPLGERIEKRRKEIGMTQTELGMALGCPLKSAPVRIAQYEDGSRSPKYETVIELARILNTTVEELGYVVPLGERVKQARELRKFTQKELADITGLDEVTVRRYEQGERKPKIEIVSLIANVLGLDLLFFYDLPRRSQEDFLQDIVSENNNLKEEIIKLNEIIAKLKENNNILQTENLSFSDFDCSTKLDIAKEYLKNILLCNNADGTSEKIMLPAIDIISEMKNKGISKRTLENAKIELGIKSIKKGNGWYWFFE